MKIKLLFVVTIFFNVACAQEQEFFLQANKAYEKNEFQEAYNLYNKIEKKGVATWYNMGNCAYKLGNYAQALACWQCSQQGAKPAEFEAINANIAVVEEKLEIEKSQNFLQNINVFVNYFSLLVWQILFLFS